MMRPHMAHIHNTMIKKRLADEAADTKSSIRKYRDLVEKARASGYDDDAIIIELESEKDRIRKDIQCGDSLYLKGVENAQTACLASIDEIIKELKGEN